MTITINRKKRDVHPSTSTSKPAHNERDLKLPILHTISTEESSASSSSSSSLSSSDLPPPPGFFPEPQHCSKDRLSDKYEILPTILGTGHYGCVRECRNKQTGKLFAVKSIQKSKLGANYCDSNIRREVDLLCTMNHVGVMKMVDSYEDCNFLHIVMEMYGGGELFDRIIEKGYFCEKEAIQIIKQLLEAVQYLHRRDIVHRDIKPENIMFESPKDSTDDDTVKLVDFGLARKHKRGDEMMKSSVGTPYYMSPEVLKGRYDRSCDLWSIGVIAYTMLCGYPPFNGHTNHDITRSVLRGHFDFSGPNWNNVSVEAKDFICCLMRRDPRRRHTAEEALRHQWIKCL